MTDHERLCELLERAYCPMLALHGHVNHHASYCEWCQETKATVARLRSNGPDGVRVVTLATANVCRIAEETYRLGVAAEQTRIMSVLAKMIDGDSPGDHAITEAMNRIEKGE